MPLGDRDASDIATAINRALSRVHASAEIWAVAAAAVVGAGASVYSARQGANAARSSANSATDENSRQFDTIRSDTAAQRNLGTGATNILSRIYGLPQYDATTEAANADVLVGDRNLPAGTTTVARGNGYYDVLNGNTRLGELRPGGDNGRFIAADGVDIPAFALQAQQQRQAAAGTGATTPGTSTGMDFNAFLETPDYQFAKQQAMQGLDRSLLARGRGLGGASAIAGERLASGLASEQFGNTFNRLSALAGMGASATNTSAQAGLSTAANNANININAANTRASAYANGAAGVEGAVTSGLGNYLFLQQLNKGGGTGFGNYPVMSGAGMYNGGGMRVS